LENALERIIICRAGNADALCEIFAGLTVPAERSVRHPRRHRLRPVWYLLALLPAVAE